MSESTINGLDLSDLKISEGVLCPPGLREKGIFAVVTNDDDAFDDATQFFDLGRLFPNATLAIIEGAGVVHDPNIGADVVAELAEAVIASRG